MTPAAQILPTIDELFGDFGPAGTAAEGRRGGPPGPPPAPADAGRRNLRRWWRWLSAGLVVALFGLPLFVDLGRADLDNDEAIYAFAVDVMLRSGDWLTPKSAPSENEPFLEKPPLKIWIVAGTIHLGLLPNDQFGLRFWDAVFGSAAFLYVFLIGRRLGGLAGGVLAAAALFAHYPLLFAHGLRTHNMEAATVLCLCGGVSHFLAWGDSRRTAARWLHPAAVALFFVLGFMTKSVTALFLPLVLGPAALLTPGDRARLKRDWRIWTCAGLLGVALIAPWFVYQYAKVGARLWEVMFQTHVVTRFTSYLDPGHFRPWYFYVWEVHRQLLWSGVFATTLAGLALLVFLSVRCGRRDAITVLAWFGLPFIVISLLSSKLYHYVYPFLPPLALAAGCAIAGGGLLVWSLLARLISAVDRVVRARSEGILGRIVRGSCATARVIVVAAVIVALSPVAAYRANISHLRSGDHTLRSTRDCLRRVVGLYAGPGGQGPGVWAEAETISHVYHYYLKGLGPWQLRNVASDPTVYMHLYAPSKYRPVLLSRTRFESFTSLVRSGDRVLVERAARKAGLDPSALATSAAETPVALIRFPTEVLMLPGPYSACGASK